MLTGRVVAFSPSAECMGLARNSPLVSAAEERSLAEGTTSAELFRAFSQRRKWFLRLSQPAVIALTSETLR
ncbi:MAG: hypothetical protein ACTS41_01440 [Candidatus Hodgkinia cicadicola]